MFTGQVGRRHPQRQSSNCEVEARVQAECFKEMNIQTNEAENGFMKDKNCEIASGFDDREVTADFNNSNFA